MSLDKDWLDRVAIRRPQWWAFVLDVVWPLRSVMLWRAREQYK